MLCEKPFALSSEEAERMVEEGRRNGIVLAVGYVLRFFPNLELVKRFLGDGRLGKLHSIVSVYHAKPPKREWARDPAVAGGGVVQDLGSHVIDLHNWLVGDDVVDLTAFTDAVDGCRVDHNAQILLRYANEVSSTISLSWLSPKWVVEHIFTASGCTIKANGEVEATDANTGSAEMYRSGRRALIHRPGLLTAFLPVRTNPMAPYQHEIDDFVSSIIHRRQPRATGLDGLKVTRIIELLYRNRGGTSA